LFLTNEGYIAEGIVSNIFWITDGVLFTPTIETGILNGITRQFIIRLVQSLGLVIKEGYYTINDVEIADEVFFTNSIQEIVPVVHLDGKSFPGKEGKWVKILHHNYRQFCQTLWSRKEL
jgi:4-amino-4-deoxychorismate lyase